MSISKEDVVQSPSLKRNLTSLSEKCSENTSPKDFKFKLIAKSEIEDAIKHARRAKQKQQDKEDWHSFLGSRLERVIEQSADRRMLDKSKTMTRKICGECDVLESKSRRVQVNSEEDDQGGNDDVANELNLSINYELPANEVNVSHTYQLGGGLTKRLQDLLSTVGRMTSLLLSPGSQPRLQDEEDVDRTIKRSLQFDTMFARNHLYEIQRLLKDTKQVVMSKTTNTADLESRISAALKSVTQALQVYSRHISKGSRVKYQQVVPIFQSIGRISSLLERLTGQRLFPLRQEIEVSCSYMKQVLLELSATETGTVSTVSRNSARLNHRHRPSADLSMYNRRQKEWHKKSASLARAKFGLPSVIKCLGKPLTAVKSSQEILKNGPPEKSLTDPINSNNFEKSQLRQKESINCIEAPFRNATRAVPEENVMTMMELIPLEPLDDTELCLDESAFQAIKLLNSGVCLPLKEEGFDMPQRCSLKSQHEDGGKKHVPVSCIFDQSNSVKLICVTERTPRTSANSARQVEEADITKDNCITLTVDEELSVEALGYQQKIVDYHKSNSHYKDDKALGIVDRLANQILADMLIDFQHNEMDRVVRMLYNLEFE